MNIIYFNPDQLRADLLGCYGDPLVQTPNFDRLAREGVRFDQCHVQHTVCTPSRCSFTTGWYPHVRGHRTLWHTLQPDEPNTLKYLKSAGYEVHWIGKNDLLSPDAFADAVTRVHDWTWQGGGARDRFAPDEPGFQSFLFGPSPGHMTDWFQMEQAVEFLRGRQPDDAPFMLYLPFVLPHCPFTCPQPWYDMYDPEALPPMRPADLPHMPAFHRLIRRYRRLDEMDARTLRKLRAVYLGMISYVDAILGRLLDALDETGLAESTALYAFSDHGEWAGDYGLVEKWPSGLDDCLTRVPLLVRAPGCQAGHAVAEPVELFDIMPTTLEMAGVACTHTHFAQSLAPQLAGAAGDPARAVFAEGGYDPHEPHCFEGMVGGFQDVVGDPHGVYYPKGLQQQEHPASVGRCAMIRTATHKLVHRPADVSELYDLAADPAETVNRYGDPACAAVQGALERRLLDWYVRTSDVVPWQRDDRGFPNPLPGA
jgi:choline-sulfatase